MSDRLSKPDLYGDRGAYAVWAGSVLAYGPGPTPLVPNTCRSPGKLARFDDIRGGKKQETDVNFIESLDDNQQCFLEAEAELSNALVNDLRHSTLCTATR